ncbi:MAG: hypothetical protein E4H14_09910 [Candidatus Thorarchaeota archaeon]|nr:MAG: hypothetical protein E4H14_09910 [Candidatus Thorarchaeota archaeon]
MSYGAPTEPMLNEPKGKAYAEFSEGNEIVWIVADDNPRDWEVCIDGEFWSSDAWNFETIVVNIDGLPYGLHTVVITVWDLSNNDVSDTVLVTVFDDIDPVMNSPHDMYIFVGISGNELAWIISDQNPDNYELYQDDVLVASGSWASSPWTYRYSINGFAEGTYVFMLTIYDIDGNSVSDYVTVYVQTDDIDPIINHPGDINMTVGTIGNYIVWTATDTFPSHYAIVENATVVGTGNWGGTTISLSLDNLPAGHYTFTITVYDSGGNTATDSVNVSVIPVGGWPALPLPDYTLAIIAVIGAAGAVAVVVIVVYTLRKKKAGAA